MATRTQGLLLGCLVLFMIGGFFLVASSILLSSSWPGGDLGGLGGGRVGLVIIEGPIEASRDLVQEIDDNRTDPSIKAVVLRVDSPGGEVAPSQELHSAVNRLAEAKPVVASLGSVAASGGYYVAVAADSIIADPGTLTGSIGVIFAYPTAKALMDKVGVTLQVYKSGELKDMGSYAREPTEEEGEVFDALIADVYDQFVSAVADGRKMEKDRVIALADGRVYTGRQAVDIGLVDRLGDLHEAINVAAELGGLQEDPSVVRKAKPRIPLIDLLDTLLGSGARATWGPRLEYRLR